MKGKIKLKVTELRVGMEFTDDDGDYIELREIRKHGVLLVFGKSSWELRGQNYYEFGELMSKMEVDNWEMSLDNWQIRPIITNDSPESMKERKTTFIEQYCISNAHRNWGQQNIAHNLIKEATEVWEAIHNPKQD